MLSLLSLNKIVCKRYKTDNTKKIRFLRSGFLGHCNDSLQYQFLPSIERGQNLHFPDNLCLLPNSCPNSHLLLTLFRNNQAPAGLDQLQEDVSLLNLCHKRHRVTVEHVISCFKMCAAMKLRRLQTRALVIA